MTFRRPRNRFYAGHGAADWNTGGYDDNRTRVPNVVTDVRQCGG